MERPSAPRSQNGSSQTAGTSSAGGTDLACEGVRGRSRVPSSSAIADRIKVAVVDPHPLYRQGLVNAVAGSRLVVVAEGGTADEAPRTVLKGKPDVLLLDIAVPGDGMGIARQVLRLRPGLKVVVLTASEDEEDVADALRMGVHGYILKEVSGPELVSAVEAICRGEPYVTPALASRLLMRGKGRPLAPHRIEDVGLTAHDRRILGYVGRGLTNQEIARSLGMNVRTVKHYLTRVFRKMGVRNRVEATVEAQRMRLELDGPAAL
jgi:two-component system, NarL family, nitrate/nitrite response regulator NarL